MSTVTAYPVMAQESALPKPRVQVARRGRQKHSHPPAGGVLHSRHDAHRSEATCAAAVTGRPNGHRRGEQAAAVAVAAGAASAPRGK